MVWVPDFEKISGTLGTEMSFLSAGAGFRVPNRLVHIGYR